jgi:hypothetical protein
VPNRRMVKRAYPSAWIATPILWPLALVPFMFATAALADGESEQGQTRLTVSQRTIAADVHADIPAPLLPPLPSLFGAPVSISALSAVEGSGAQTTDVETGDDGSSGPKTTTAKSPGKALFLSALLPGAGEFYAGNRKRAAIFFGLEALGWALWSHWDGKGNDIVDEFRATAREQWDWKSYFSWQLQTDAQKYNSFTHSLPCSEYLVIDDIEGLAKCPESEVQQYYELIGKYNQFVVGWRDLKYVDNSGTAVPSAVDSVESVYSDNRFEYERRRDDSNKFLERASTMSGLILVNHVLSAIDASRVARDTAEGKSAAAIESRTRFALTTRDGLRGGPPIFLAYKPFY